MPELERRLTLFDLTMIVVGSSIGSGIFVTPAAIARELPSPYAMLLVWAAGGVMTLCGALTFAELGAMLPRAGGVYVFLGEAYGRLFGFLYGWAYFLVVTTGALAALSLAFATYVGWFFPLGPWGTKVVAVCGLAAVTAINVFGVKVGAIFSDVFTLLKLLGIVALIVVGIAFGSSSATDFAAPMTAPPAKAFAAAMVGVLWSYGGWQYATFAAGEAKRPKRDVGIALVFGATLVGVVYVTTNVAYLRLMSPATMATTPQLASVAVSSILGRTGGALIALAIIVSTLGTVGIYVMTAPRIYFAMAAEGLFFEQAARIHPRYRTPARAIVMQSVWAVVLILFWGTFENLISYVVFTDFLFLMLAAASVFVFRWRRPGAERPYRTVGYPVTPLVFIAICAWFLADTLRERPREALAGLGFLALGIPVFLYWSRANRASRALARRIPATRDDGDR